MAGGESLQAAVASPSFHRPATLRPCMAVRDRQSWETADDAVGGVSCPGARGHETPPGWAIVVLRTVRAGAEKGKGGRFTAEARRAPQSAAGRPLWLCAPETPGRPIRAATVEKKGVAGRIDPQGAACPLARPVARPAFPLHRPAISRAKRHGRSRGAAGFGTGPSAGFLRGYIRAASLLTVLNSCQLGFWVVVVLMQPNQ